MAHLDGLSWTSDADGGGWQDSSMTRSLSESSSGDTGPAAFDSCAQPCGRSTCGAINETFSCQMLTSLSCSCTGCCVDDPAADAGALFVVSVFVLWLVCFVLSLRYRRRAHKKWGEILEKVKETYPDFKEDEPDDVETHLDGRGRKWMRKKRRYHFTFLGVLLPCLPVTCPDLYAYLQTSLQATKASIKLQLSVCLASFKRAFDECRGHFASVERTARTGYRKTKRTTQLVRRDLKRTRVLVKSGARPGPQT